MGKQIEQISEAYFYFLENIPDSTMLQETCRAYIIQVSLYTVNTYTLIQRCRWMYKKLGHLQGTAGV